MNTPFARLTGRDGTLNRFWWIDDPVRCAAVAAAMVDRWILIAGGHHRYEAAIHYRKERRQTVTAAGRTTRRIGMHRTDVDTSRLTITTPGICLLTGNVAWLNNTTGARELNIRKNGTVSVARVVQPADPTNTSDQVVTTLVQLAAGDFVEPVVRHNAGWH